MQLAQNKAQWRALVKKIMKEDGCLLGCSALMMEAARTSGTLVNFYQTTRRYNPEDSHLRTHRRENLKSYLIMNIRFIKCGESLNPAMRNRCSATHLCAAEAI
jgi:hypothetical protein